MRINTAQAKLRIDLLSLFISSFSSNRRNNVVRENAKINQWLAMPLLFQGRVAIVPFLFLIIWCVCSDSGVVALQNQLVEDETFLHKPYYFDNNGIGGLFTDLVQKYPHLAKAYTIGRTLQNRQMHALAVKLWPEETTSKHRVNLEPLVKLNANIHGDEALGRQLVIYLAEYLIRNYEKSPEIQQLLNNTEIHFLPTCNPDGFLASKEGNCESFPNYVGRANAAGVDLNRDFPDRLENQDSILLQAPQRQPETAALIEWITSKPFVLSANFHGGALVASYPYDNSIAHRDCCEESLTPDDRVFKLMAHTYADNHPIMRRGNNCNDSFAGGITNGAHWYELNGGMQDFNYAFTNCFELTIELSCCKYPPADTLPTEWQNNKRSLLELLKLAHIGIKGIVSDLNGLPIPEAKIIVSGLEGKPVWTSKRGEYWRLLTPGIYSVQATAFGYRSSEVQQVKVTNAKPIAQRLDFILLPIEQPYDGEYRKMKVIRATDPETIEKHHGFLTPVQFQHHNFTTMEKKLHEISESYPAITRLYSIGKSVEQRDLWVMEIFVTPGKHIPGIPEFKYVANMHGNEVVGKEMLLLLTQYICERYMFDKRVTKLVNNTRMHFLYSMNPDGYEMARSDDKSQFLGRTNANMIDLNRNFPDQYGTDANNRKHEPEVRAVMNWTLSIPFVLSANLHGGSLVANYPYDDNENDFNDPIKRNRNGDLKRKLNPTEDHELFKYLASVYSQSHPRMHLGTPCAEFKNEKFPGGIVNGAQWYSVTGGMQDWNYIRAGVMEITIEMGCEKYPNASELPKYWLDNRESLLSFIEQVHNGIHGFISSSIGSPIGGAAISLSGKRHAIYSTIYGDYWRLVLPGRYNLTILADGYSPQHEYVEVSSETRMMRLDITLMRDDDQHWSSANDYRILQNVINTRYHTSSEIRQQLSEYEIHHANHQIATFGYADNEFDLIFNSIKLTLNVGAPEENKFKIVILSSFSDGTAVLGGEISLNLIRHILEGYKLKEPLIRKLLAKSILYFLPIIESHDDIFNLYLLNNSICDPRKEQEFGEEILAKTNSKRKDLFLQFLDSERFDLMLTFTSADIDEINYPKDAAIFERFAHNILDVEFATPPLQCPHNNLHTTQTNVIQQLTALLYKEYKLPLFTLNLACCRMPIQTQIPSIWRKNINKLKNFLHLLDTGVMGLVHNKHGDAIRQAYVHIIGHQLFFNVSKNLAHFQILLPEGIYSIEIGAANYDSQIMNVQISQGSISNLGVLVLNDLTIVVGHSEIEAIDVGGLHRYSSKTLAGFILDTNNHPISRAKIYISGSSSPVLCHRQCNFTDQFGAYRIDGITSGNVTIKIEAKHYMDYSRVLHIASDGKSLKNVIFRLKRNENILGLSRIVFIVIASILVIVMAVVCLLCGQMVFLRRHRTSKPYYTFSLLPQRSKQLFGNDDDDDVDSANAACQQDEVELFKSPIKKSINIKPYYDNDNDHYDDDDDDDDDGIDIFNFHNPNYYNNTELHQTSKYKMSKAKLNTTDSTDGGTTNITLHQTTHRL